MQEEMFLLSKSISSIVLFQDIFSYDVSSLELLDQDISKLCILLLIYLTKRTMCPSVDSTHSDV